MVLEKMQPDRTGNPIVTGPMSAEADDVDSAYRASTFEVSCHLLAWAAHEGIIAFYRTKEEVGDGGRRTPQGNLCSAKVLVCLESLDRVKLLNNPSSGVGKGGDSQT
jgi:hypothetical protein